MQAEFNRQQIANIKRALILGWINYEEAELQAKPILENINTRGREIAKKYGRKYREITFTEVMR